MRELGEVRYRADFGYGHALGRSRRQPLRKYTRLLRVVWRGIHHLRSLYRRGLSVDAVSAETGKSCGCQSQERVVHAGSPGRRTLRRRRRTIRLATLVDRSAFRTLRGQLCDLNVRDLYWFRFSRAPAKAPQRSGATSVARPQNASAALEGGAENNAYDQITGRRARSDGR